MRIISGTLKGRTLKTVKGEGYRPATAKVREALFSMLESQGVVWSDTCVLDLYAGSGSLAFEAISRGAPHACLVEIDKQAVHCLQKNTQIFNISGNTCRIMGMDVQQFLRIPPHNPFNVIFIDPPYGQNKLLPSLVALHKHAFYAHDAFIIAEIEATKYLQLVFKAPFETPFFNKCYGQTRIIAWNMTTNVL